jgi:hypothetical protein
MLSPRRPTSSSGLRSTRELRPMPRNNPLSRSRAGLRGRAVSTKKRDKKTVVSASELSKMGVCERLVLFEARYGKRTTPCRRGAITRGRAEHDKFFRDAVRSESDVNTSLAKPWCFCASLAWGPEAPETNLLRRFRDRILRKTAFGRWFIRAYYRVAPEVCRHLEGRRQIINALRLGLMPAVWIAKVMLAKQNELRRDDN